MEILKTSGVAKLLSVSDEQARLSVHVFATEDNVDNIVHDIIKFERFHIKRRSRK